MSVPKAILRWRELVIKTIEALGYHFVDPNLVLAMIWQESSGNPWAWNPEPRYRWFWNVKTGKPFRPVTAPEIDSQYPPWDFPSLAGDRDQEWWAQQASWGLMQVMGAAGRERGFKGNFLTETVDPAINIELGIKHLWVYAFGNGQRSTIDALLKYNGGGDRNYPSKILTKKNAVEKAACQ